MTKNIYAYIISLKIEINSMTRKSKLYFVPQRVGILLQANVQDISENHLREATRIIVGVDGVFHR